jgi:hypothetical protein
MPQYYVRETFFRPPEHARQQSALPAAVYNALHLLLRRHDRDHLFIPIRSMQYQAVAARDEVIFVDSQGGYAYQGGLGGRLIRLAWRPALPMDRDSITGPVPCEIVYYFPEPKETHWRLMSEFPRVLEQALKRQREQALKSVEPQILPFRRDV